MSSIFERHEDVMFSADVPFEQQEKVRQKVKETRSDWLEELAKIGLAAALMYGGKYGTAAGLVGQALNLQPNMESAALINVARSFVGKSELPVPKVGGSSVFGQKELSTPGA